VRGGRAMAKSELGYMSKAARDRIVAAVHDELPKLRRIRATEVAPGDLLFEIEPYTEGLRCDVLVCAWPILPNGCEAGVVLWRDSPAMKIYKTVAACKPAMRGLQPEATPKTRARKAPKRKPAEVIERDALDKVRVRSEKGAAPFLRLEARDEMPGQADELDGGVMMFDSTRCDFIPPGTKIFFKGARKEVLGDVIDVKVTTARDVQFTPHAMNAAEVKADAERREVEAAASALRDEAARMELRGHVFAAMMGEFNAAFARLGFKFEVQKIEVNEAPLRSVLGGCDVILQCVGTRR
jgi:hypothetical protein